MSDLSNKLLREWIETDERRMKRIRLEKSDSEPNSTTLPIDQWIGSRPQEPTMPLQHKTFAHHTPSQSGIEKIRDLRKAFDDVQSLIEGLAPHSRERSVALTHLETTAMWAIKAVVVNDPESKVEDV